MNQVEQAKVAVLLDGRDAEQGLKDLTAEVDKYTNALLQAYKAGDKDALKKANAELKAAERNLTSFKKQTFEVANVLNNLNGSSLNDLKRAEKEITAEMAKMTRGTKEYIAASGKLKQVKDELGKVRTEMSGVSKQANILSQIKSILPAVSIAAGVAMLTNLGKELFNLAKTMQGEAVRSAVVFGDQLGYVEQEADKLASKMGLTNREFVAMAASTADLLIPLDFTRQQAAEMSVQLQSLTGALDEWTAGSIGAKGVSEILTKAMLGENEQLKQLGIAIRKDSDEYRNLVKQKLETTGATKAQAEAMATLELIQRKSQDAQTAYTQDGNKLLRLQKDVVLFIKERKERFIELFDVEEKQVDLYKLENRELNARFNALKSDNLSTAAKKKLIEEINSEYGQYLPKLLTEKSTLDEIAIAQESVNKQLRLKIIQQAFEEEITNVLKEEAKAYQALAGSQIDNEVAAEQRTLALTQEETARLKLQQTNANIMGTIAQATIDNSEKEVDAVKNKFKRIGEMYNIAFDEIQAKQDIPPPKETEKEVDKDKENKIKEALAAQQDYYTQLEKLANDFERSQWSKNEQELMAVEDKYNALIEKAITSGQDITELEILHEAERNALWLKQKEEADKEKLDKEKEFQERKLETLKQYQLLSFEELKEIELEQARQLYEELGIEKELYEQMIAEIEKRYSEAKAAQTQEEFQKKLATIQMYAAAVTDVLNVVSDNATLSKQNEIKRIELAEQKKLKNVKKGSEEETAIKEKFEAQKLAVEKKYADSSFNMKIAQIGASTAQAIMSVWGNNLMPYPAAAVFNGIMTGLILVNGFKQAQAAKLERQRVQQLYTGKYNVVGAADGKAYSADYHGPVTTSGIINSGRPTLINERGGEYIATAEHINNVRRLNPDLFNAFHSYRVPQRAEGNYMQAPAAANDGTEMSAQLLIAINQLTQVLPNIKAKVVYSDIKDAETTVTRIEKDARGY
jgi:hypothetical protein